MAVILNPHRHFMPISNVFYCILQRDCYGRSTGDPGFEDAPLSCHTYSRISLSLEVEIRLLPAVSLLPETLGVLIAPEEMLEPGP